MDDANDGNTHPRAGRLTTLEHDGLRFEVFDDGPMGDDGDSGDPGDVAVLLHGFPERSTCWRLVRPLLHDAGLRTVALDQRGYSPGARPPRRRDYVADLLAGDVAALIEELRRRQPGARVHLVGHDWGAVVAWTLAAARPELLASLTAVSVPHPAAFLGSMTRSTQGLKSWYMGFFQLPRVPELVARRRGGLMDSMLRRTGMGRDDVARFRTEIVDDGALTYALNWYRALPFLDRASARAPVRVPTTMVWSTGDTALGRAGIDATAAFVDAPYELVVLDDVSHWIPAQAPEALAAAVLRGVAR